MVSTITALDGDLDPPREVPPGVLPSGTKFLEGTHCFALRVLLGQPLHRSIGIRTRVTGHYPAFSLRRARAPDLDPLTASVLLLYPEPLQVAARPCWKEALPRSSQDYGSMSGSGRKRPSATPRSPGATIWAARRGA
jgi:hypothetical protein